MDQSTFIIWVATSGIFFVASAGNILLAPLAIALARNSEISQDVYAKLIVWCFASMIISAMLTFIFFIEIYESEKIAFLYFTQTLHATMFLPYAVIVNATAKRLNAKGKSRWRAWALAIPVIGPFLILGIQKEA
ncbi:MAG: hypothetical protein EBS78_09640 [Altererythrobacter sp.]|jgi:uncharacterized membrane protein YhaH (DUF805 family)|nr:hypothetical protein [Altererythrobacter sp.]